MPEKHSRKTPNAKRLLATCQRELNDIIQQLPPGAAIDVRKNIGPRLSSNR